MNRSLDPAGPVGPPTGAEPGSNRPAQISARELVGWLEDAHAFTSELTFDLCPGAEGPRLAIVNPARWEIGHVAWFTERWFLRAGLGLAPELEGADHLFDSMVLKHEERWDAHLPRFEQVCDSLRGTLDRTLRHVERAQADPRLRALLLLCLFHQDMHNEAFAYTRQSHAWSATPRLEPRDPPDGATAVEELICQGGPTRFGARADQLFAFDNEGPAHERVLRPFAIASRVVSVGEFLAFVKDGGYARPELWGPEGRAFLAGTGATHPLYWRPSEDGSFQQRHFEKWRALEPGRPMIHVSWFEAEAYARWDDRRLPSEFEWEHAARVYPEHFGRAAAWEWTADPFLPYAGFQPGDYRDYSEPWFGSRRVLRGASHLTPARMRWPSLRNFYEPHRRDVWNGFRTAAR